MNRSAVLVSLLWTLVCPISAHAVGHPVVQSPQGDVLRVIAMPTVGELSDSNLTSGLEIDEVFLREWRRLKDKAVADGATVLVLELTTPGGQVIVTEQILEDLRKLRELHRIRTVAYVPSAASSAGALIGTATGQLLMATGATTGNAIPLLVNGGVVSATGPKMRSHVLGIARKIGQTTPFDTRLLEGMVDEDLELWAVESNGAVQIVTAAERDNVVSSLKNTGAVPRSTLLTSGTSAFVYAHGERHIPGFDTVFPVTTCESRAEIRSALGLSPAPLESQELLQIPIPAGGFGRELLRHIDWSIILLVLGIMSMILELKTPGLGLFAVIGILCFIGYFWVNAGDGLPLAFSIGLLILGFLLLFAELLIIPGFGIAGIAGILLLLVAIYSSTVDLGGETLTERLLPDSEGDWIVVRSWLTLLFGTTVVAIALAVLLIKNLHHIPLINRAFVQPATASGPAHHGSTPSGTVDLVLGLRGVTQTPLRPSGRARFRVGDVDVVSEGTWVEAGETVTIVQIDGARVVVRLEKITS